MLEISRGGEIWLDTQRSERCGEILHVGSSPTLGTNNY